MQSPSAREWRTCRIYDPAIDYRDKVDADGNPITKRVGDDDQRVCRSDAAAFLQDRDPSVLTFIEGRQPAWFVLSPLGIGQLRHYVERPEDTAERYLRAFECAIVRIDGWACSAADAPVSLAFEQSTIDGVARAKESEIDKAMQAGLTLSDIREIGAAAYARASVPLGFAGRSQVPRSSLVALATHPSRSLSADLSAEK